MDAKCRFNSLLGRLWISVKLIFICWKKEGLRKGRRGVEREQGKGEKERKREREKKIKRGEPFEL